MIQVDYEKLFESFRKSGAKVKQMTPEQAMERLIEFGLYERDGELAERYGGKPRKPA